TLEPGEGHAQHPASREVVRLYGVTEKDMPPHHLIRVGRAVGFCRARVFVRPPRPEPVFDSDAPPPPPRSRRSRGARSARRALEPLLAGAPEPAWQPALRGQNLVVLEK